MPPKRDGDVVVITGASAGVGRAVAREFARRGASLGLIARGHDRLQAACEDVERLGGRAIGISADVADADAVEAAAETIERDLGPIDIWVNNAMTTVFAPFDQIRPEEYRRATEVTYLGTVWGTMAALRRMIPRDRGTIVQVGSALSYRGIPLQAPYCGAKHAVRGFTDALRCELMHEGRNIQLTMVQLPALNTPQFNWCRSKLPNHPQPVPPIYQPEVAADAIVWAAYHRRREVYVGRSAVTAIVGNKLAPWYADRHLAKNGYASQQTEEEVDAARPDNLFEPVEADYAAHGIFDDRAADSSWQLWLTKHRGWLLAGAAVVGGALAVAGGLLSNGCAHDE
ncbi:MAG: SDR family oxidoreductase [Planctomycetes bacterium]|nr:SDR family oxidoreductase [Planctomycetota bacterium]